MLKLGLGSADMTPTESIPMAGYSERVGTSTGVHDPLKVHAWMFGNEDDEPWIWFMLDLCVVDPATCNTLKAKAGELLGMDENKLLVSLSHTHSGPDVRSITDDAEPWEQRYSGRLVSAMEQAARAAMAGTFRGSIEVRCAPCNAGVNRRTADGPVDQRLVILSLTDLIGKQRGIIFHYACHPTVLGYDNMLISPDWVGPVGDYLHECYAVPAAFIQGAMGDIDPHSRGLLDLADPEQARGRGFDVVDEVASRVIRSVDEALGSPVICVIDTVRVASTELTLPLRYGALNPEQVDAHILSMKNEFSQFLGVPLRQLTGFAKITGLVKEAGRTGAKEEDVRRWVANTLKFFSFDHFYAGTNPFANPVKGTLPCIATVIDFGNLRLLGGPFEFLGDVGRDWQARNADKVALVTSLLGGWMDYLPHENNFHEPGADLLYETARSPVAPEAASIFLDGTYAMANEP